MRVIDNSLTFISKYSMEAKATIAFIIAQILFKIIFEFEGSKKFAESNPMPAFTIIIIFTVVWIIICVLCLANLKIGYLLAIIVGVLNLFPLILLAIGIAPFQDRPYFNGWITLCLIYFSFQVYNKSFVSHELGLTEEKKT